MYRIVALCSAFRYSKCFPHIDMLLLCRNLCEFIPDGFITCSVLTFLKNILFSISTNKRSYIFYFIRDANSCKTSGICEDCLKKFSCGWLYNKTSPRNARFVFPSVPVKSLVVVQKKFLDILDLDEIRDSENLSAPLKLLLFQIVFQRKFRIM